MRRFVLGPDVALELAKSFIIVPTGHKLLAPMLLRSQVLTHLYAAVKSGEMDKTTADEHLDYLRSLKIRLLGDRVLQRVAWEIAAQLNWPDTYQAEYLGLTRLQADAFVTLDSELAKCARGVVTVAAMEELTGEID